MEGKDTEEFPAGRPREDDRNELEEGSPIPDPEDEEFGSEDMPEAD
jgi:hypothetical protein